MFIWERVIWRVFRAAFTLTRIYIDTVSRPHRNAVLKCLHKTVLVLLRHAEVITDQRVLTKIRERIHNFDSNNAGFAPVMVTVLKSMPFRRHKKPYHFENAPLLPVISNRSSFANGLGRCLVSRRLTAPKTKRLQMKPGSCKRCLCNPCTHCLDGG